MSSLYTRGIFFGLQQRDEHLWSCIPSPGEYVPLRLVASGCGAMTLIERVWTPLGDDLGELVFCKVTSWAGVWGAGSRVRFPLPLETLTQQQSQILQVNVRVTGPLDSLLLLCVDRGAADFAAAELEPVDALLAQARPA